MCPWCNASVVSCWGVPAWWCMVLGSYCVVWGQKMCALKSPMSLVMSDTSIFVWRGRYGPPCPQSPCSAAYRDTCKVDTVVFNGYLMPFTEWKYCLWNLQTRHAILPFLEFSLLHWRRILKKVTQDWRQRKWILTLYFTYWLYHQMPQI